MDTYKIWFGYISIIIGIIGYIPYFRGIISKKTKPHAFSWLVWTITVGITFIAQITKHGGAGTWATGLTTAVCFIIFLFAVVKGDRRFATIDWISLSIAFAGIILWITTKNSTLSVILGTTADAFGFFPTLRKGFYKPQEDSPTLWILTVIKWTTVVIALQAYTFATLLYPIYLIIINSLFAAMLWWRKKQ